MEVSIQSPVSLPQADPIQQVVDALRSELLGFFQVERVGSQGRGQTIAFVGQLLVEADKGYAEIEQRFKSHGYTPLFRRQRGEDVVLAIQGISNKARTGNPLINIVLLIATIITTLAAGAGLAGQTNVLDAFLSMDPGRIISTLIPGIPFSLALMSILAVHEFGHYYAAKYHGIVATLPYFIPLPIGGLGTLGAFISVRSPMKNRKVLFDIGIAGPLAGLVVAIPLLVIGLLLSEEAIRLTVGRGFTLAMIGTSVLVDWLIVLFRDVPAGQTLILHPIFFAAWISLLITAINLLPIGQLDGGHIIYGLFGQQAYLVARLLFIGLILAGIFLSTNWFFWAAFVFLGGLKHPPPLNDITDLDIRRKILGLFTILLFFLIVVPIPFQSLIQ